MVGVIIGAVLWTYIVVGMYRQIPKEDPEIIRAREEYGVAK